ncbi:protein translocase subunit SecF [Candidatus Dependentiae bacterium]|nr:protein translocase subunit SecF [Candidatus Dependentiae bacterium]
MIDFLGRKYLLVIASVVLLSIAPAAYFLGYGLKYHIDFTGGTEVRLSFGDVQDISNVRSAVKSSGFDDAVIQQVGSTGKGFLVTLGETSPGVSQDLVSGLSARLNASPVVDGVELVGAGAGKEVRNNAFFAILLTMLVLLFYIAFRRTFAYGVGAVVALLHDLVLLFGFLMVAQIPFSLHILAAVLALLGYSLNDTVVIFAQIRENAQNLKLKNESAYNIVKISLNEVLRRTLLTSFSTFLALVPLIFLGTEAVSHFALTMAVAVVIGTYSSVFVASPVMLAIGDNKL